MSSGSSNLSIVAPGAAAGFALTLQQVRDFGVHVPADDSSSVGTGRPTREVMNFTTVIERPRDRLIRNPKYGTPIVSAIARFVWMMAGNNRLADIAYYEPRVTNFSDDGL